MTEKQQNNFNIELFGTVHISQKGFQDLPFTLLLKSDQATDNSQNHKFNSPLPLESFVTPEHFHKEYNLYLKNEIKSHKIASGFLHLDQSGNLALGQKISSHVQNQYINSTPIAVYLFQKKPLNSSTISIILSKK
ncbi:hypothetical protein CL619_00335 [archaeon]|nr:hypothetical protein [archaeon]|tara:strand:+ start:301 stop:705 length:405 start_codon:yes stop_codon:yes gene_type:complete